MIDALTVQNFRNITSIDYLCSRLNIFIGDNGSGKTSLLEALHYITYVSSFRATKREQLLQWGAPYFLLSLTGRSSQPLRLCCFRDRETMKVGEQVKTRRQYTQFLYNKVAAATISPHCDSLVNGDPARRRQWLDNIMFHVEHTHKQTWQAYEHALTSRNALLRSKRYNDDEFWLHKLAESGTALHEARKICFDSLSEFINKWLACVGLHRVSLSLFSGWTHDQDSLLNSYYKNLPIDRANGYTGLGAHKADVEIYWQPNKLAKHYASRGQSKLLNLALIFAQLDFLRGHTDNQLLLLDDVTAEFDCNYLELLCKKLLPSIEAQVFITSIEYNKRAFSLLPKEDLGISYINSGCLRQSDT